MRPTIESLEARLEQLRIEEVPAADRARVREERDRIRGQLAQMRLERAESWSRQDWLSFIEGVIDELGRLVDNRIMRRLGV